MPDVFQLTRPVLAISIDSHTMSALWYTPGPPLAEQSVFRLISPEADAARRMREARESRRAVYLHGVSAGPLVIREILEHTAAGLGVALHPALAATLCRDPAVLDRHRIAVSSTRPSAALSVGCFDFDADLWHSLQSAAGLPDPAAVLVAAGDGAVSFEAAAAMPDKAHIYAPNARFQAERCRRRFHGEPGGPLVDDFFLAEAPAHLLRLSAIQRRTGGPVIDTSGALMAAVLADPRVRRRNWEEGVLAVQPTHSKLFAALVYRERCCGILEQLIPPADADADVPDLLALLEDFRLGRLTPEGMALRNGSVCMIPELPPEAEGFRPMYAIGARASLLRAHAQIPDGQGGAEAPCIGLLHAYSRALRAETPQVPGTPAPFGN